VRRDSKSNGLQETGTDGQLACGGGLLQLAKQRPTEDVGEAKEAIRFLVLFTRELIRNNPSSDVLYLSMSAAAKRANLTKNQAEKFISWVTQEMSNAPWPDGFF